MTTAEKPKCQSIGCDGRIDQIEVQMGGGYYPEKTEQHFACISCDFTEKIPEDNSCRCIDFCYC
jgi:hypothetical protein